MNALDVINVEELKAIYLFGLDLTNDQGIEYPDLLYRHGIEAAVSWLEHKLDIPILPVDVEEAQDFYREDYAPYMALDLNQYPVISATKVELRLPGGQIARTYTGDWLSLEKESGQLHIVPGSGAASVPLVGAAGSWLPIAMSYFKFIPAAFRIWYRAGLDPVPPVIKDLVGKIASFAPLNIAGDLLGGAGIASQSVGIDGLSQNFNTTSSATNAGYGARLVQYNREIKDMIPTLQKYYKGIRMRVV